MKRRRRGVVVDPSALSRKQARRKAEEKLKTVALQRDPERLNGSLNVSSPHRSNVSSFPFVGRREGVTFTKWEFSSDGIKAEVDNRLSRIPNYVVIFSLPHYKMQFEGIMRLSFISSLSLERERGWKRCGIEYVSYRGDGVFRKTLLRRSLASLSLGWIYELGRRVPDKVSEMKCSLGRDGRARAAAIGHGLPRERLKRAAAMRY